MSAEHGFRQELGWAAEEDTRLGRANRISGLLRWRGKQVENPLEVVRTADTFFFENDNLRIVQPIEATAAVVARLLEQALYHPYVHNRSLYTIPTVEFITAVAGIIQELQPKRVLEVGAGDGTLAHFLQKATPARLILAIDDHKYGGRLTNEQTYNPTIKNRPIYPIVQNKTMTDAIREYNPDFILSSWFVEPYKNPGDDIQLLQHPSVRYMLWIGDQCEWSTSTPELWHMPGWKRERLPLLERLHFTYHDARYKPTPTFPVGCSPKQLAELLQRHQEGKVVLFSKN